jgi:hypothetical protein
LIVGDHLRHFVQCTETAGKGNKAIGYPDKPLGILNVEGYFDRLLDFFHYMTGEGFLRKEHLDNLIVESDFRVLLERLEAYKPVQMEKWIRDIKDESR